MSKYNALKHDQFLPGTVLREMGASSADDSGIIWTPRDQIISKDGRNVTLTPDPESLRVVFAKFAQAFGKKKPKISETGPAFAYKRMLKRHGMRALMMRLQRRGLVPKGPNLYASLKKPMSRPARKPQATASSPIVKPVNALNIMPDVLEKMAGPVARSAGKKLGVKGALMSLCPV